MSIQLLRDDDRVAIQDLIRSAIANGQGYSATIGLFTSGASTNNSPFAQSRKGKKPFLVLF